MKIFYGIVDIAMFASIPLIWWVVFKICFPKGLDN